MTTKEIYAEISEMSAGGAKHRTMVDFLKRQNHNGYDISEDETLIIAHFKDFKIIISPYRITELVRIANDRKR